MGDGESDVQPCFVYLHATITKVMKGPFALLLFLTLIISTPVIIFLHELGHSIFALLFTKQGVKMFVGSYGKTEKTREFTFGRLQLYIEPKFKLGGGMCVHHHTNKTYKELILIFAGPALPLSIAILFYSFCVHYLNDNWVAAAIFFIIFCFVSFLKSLIPSSRPIILTDGSQTFNDGRLILNTLKNRSFQKEYRIAADYFNAKDYTNGSIHFAALIDKHKITDRLIHTYYLYSLYSNKDLNRLKDFVFKHYETVNFNKDDLSNIGVYFSRLEDHESAMHYYKKSLNLEENANALNNMGYSMNILERYTEALPYFEKAIAIEPEQAYAYNNRGYAKLKLGFIEEGFEDFETSNKLDPNNSYYYKNLGLYHFDKGNYSTALEHFIKAKEMDDETYKIDDDIETVKWKLGMHDSIT
ncbi:tetratricopeptide repeat protein [Flavobacterium sp. RHBU_24]|uniref:tetratricopeptide repeat protein n=1 Tax=Flavobacterium sp. RHBU_24 TaxID=3391185 RepID=UPI0039848B51